MLEKYHPDIIGTEEVSGSQIAQMKRRGGVYSSVVQFFGSTHLKYGQKAQESLNITWTKADTVADSLMAEIQHTGNISDAKRL